MRIAICDDDSLFIEQFLKYLKDFFKRSHLACPEILTFDSGEALLLNSSVKDIVFLDVEMPGLSGIAVGNELKKENKDVIIFIITSYAEYLDEAMRFHVFRYLPKPLEKQRFFRNMKDALYLYSTLSVTVPIETRSAIVTVKTVDIISVEAIGRKVIVHTLSTDYESIHTMAYWLEALPENSFFQSHRSFLINMAHVTDFDHTLIHLCNRQFSAYLTKRKYTDFKAAYYLYLESMR